jgi:type II secretion system protein I
MRRKGFTLLEVLVATTIMALTIVGLVSLLSNTLRNASRLTDYDRATILAKRKMDELLLDRQIPRFIPVEGSWPAEITGSAPVGWRAMVSPYDFPPNFGPGMAILDRIELTVAWKSGEQLRTFTVEGFRSAPLTGPDTDRLRASIGAAGP